MVKTLTSVFSSSKINDSHFLDVYRYITIYSAFWHYGKHGDDDDDRLTTIATHLHILPTHLLSTTYFSLLKNITSSLDCL